MEDRRTEQRKKMNISLYGCMHGSLPLPPSLSAHSGSLSPSHIHTRRHEAHDGSDVERSGGWIDTANTTKDFQQHLQTQRGRKKEWKKKYSEDDLIKNERSEGKGEKDCDGISVCFVCLYVSVLCLNLSFLPFFFLPSSYQFEFCSESACAHGVEDGMEVLSSLGRINREERTQGIAPSREVDSARRNLKSISGASGIRSVKGCFDSTNQSKVTHQTQMKRKNKWKKKKEKREAVPEIVQRKMNVPLWCWHILWMHRTAFFLKRRKRTTKIQAKKKKIAQRKKIKAWKQSSESTEYELKRTAEVRRKSPNTRIQAKIQKARQDKKSNEKKERNEKTTPPHISMPVLQVRCDSGNERLKNLRLMDFDQEA